MEVGVNFVLTRLVCPFIYCHGKLHLHWHVVCFLLCYNIQGNSIVIKPSELTPLTASALAQVVHEVGLPKGVFNMVHGYGKDAGNAMVEHKHVRLISFTGGTVTGKHGTIIASIYFV